MECLGENAEKYITFKVSLRKENKDGKLITFKLKFIHSVRFMKNSLSDLAANRSCRSCVYPYDYMDGWGRFNGEILPPIIEFYNKLNQKGITDEDCKHTHKVWDTFRIKNLGEYHNLYVQSDTLQLADIFENFRKTCQKIYQLDPAHFVFAPGLAWHV